MNSLEANIRENSTKGQLNAIRNKGNVPAIIYGGKDKNQKVSISKKLLNAGLAIVDKRRPKPGQSKVMNVIGDVKDQTCIIVDDIIDSGGTIVNAAKALKERGAKEVYVYITHGVLSGDAVKKIKSSVIKNLVITDTIDNTNKIKNVKNIEVLPISGLMGEAIKRISNSTSVSDLFK